MTTTAPAPEGEQRLNTTDDRVVAFVERVTKDGSAARIAGAIRSHAERDALDWRYRRIVEELHRWGERFIRDFALVIPTPVLAVERLRIDTLGQYTLGRSAIGTRTTVTMNARWIASQPFRDTLVTLLHELVHAWDEWANGRQSARGAHGRVWRDRITAIGVVLGPRGSTAGITPELEAYFDRYGVPRLEDLIDPEAPPTKGRAMPKWVCGCPSGNPARAVHLTAVCLECQESYRPA